MAEQTTDNRQTEVRFFSELPILLWKNEMPYSLRRTRDGAGDVGISSEVLIPVFSTDNTSELIVCEVSDSPRPQVGGIMRVGSLFARSFSAQDYWQTTIITEILEDTSDEEGNEYVRFRTGNSEYEWKRF
jgi:hypothetical protein